MAQTVLENLNDTGLVLADPGQDIRGHKVIDCHGDDVGHVSNLFTDAEEGKVRMLEVRAGGFLGLGARHFLLPVDAITSVAKDEVRVSETRDRIVGSPVYDPALVAAPTHAMLGPYYGYYGHPPYWSSGYEYPDFPAQQF